jgi:hypothetical protein
LLLFRGICFSPWYSCSLRNRQQGDRRAFWIFSASWMIGSGKPFLPKGKRCEIVCFQVVIMRKKTPKEKDPCVLDAVLFKYRCYFVFYEILYFIKGAQS